MFDTNQVESADQSSDSSAFIIAIVSLFIAVVAIAFAPIFIKSVEREISPNATIFNRLWVAAIVFGLWNGLVAVRRRFSTKEQIKEKKSYSIRVLGLLLAMGICHTASYLLWAWSLTQTLVAHSTLMHNLIPLFTVLGGWLLFGQQFEHKFLLGMAIAIGGMIMIGIDDISYASGQIQGDAMALLSAISYAVYLLILEQLSDKFSATTLVFWCCAIGTLLTLPVLAITQDRFFPSSWEAWCFLISLALVCQALGQGLVAYSVNRLSSGFVAITLLLDPVLSAIFAWAIFSERLNVLSLVSFGIILSGIYLAISSQSAVKPQ